MSLDVTLEEELFRVYKRLPYVSEKEFTKKYPEKLGGKRKFDREKSAVQKIGGTIAEHIDGKRCVYEITSGLREMGYEVTPDIVFKILEEFRELGAIRVQMLKTPETVMKEKVYTTTPKLEVTREEVPEGAKVPEAKPKPEPKKAEVAKPEVEEPEVEAVEKELADMLADLETAPSETRLTKASEKGGPVLEALLNMNDDIEIAAVCTNDGYSVSFASRKEIKIDELKVAASSAVIGSVSEKNLGYLDKGEPEEIIVYSEEGLIYLLPISQEYLLTLTATKGAQVGTLIRDAVWASRRVKSELQHTEA